MLRRSKGSSGNTKKRHSMFLDFTHSMLSSGDPIVEPTLKQTLQSKNKSLDTLSLEDDLTLQDIPSKPRKKTNTNRKTSKLKRSSVVLDNTLLREYNIAVDHFEKSSAPIQNSHSNNSISSNSSRISSLFSSNSCLSIRDLLSEDVTEDNEGSLLGEKPLTKLPSEKKTSKKPNQIFNNYVFGSVDDVTNEQIWRFDDVLFDRSSKPTYKRTNLYFD